MIKFKLIKGFYIRRQDSGSWILAKAVKNNGVETEEVEGCYCSLEEAWHGAFGILPLKLKNFPELQKNMSEEEKSGEIVSENGVCEIDTGKSVISVNIKYPEENPRDSINDIVNGLDYCGLFEDLK